MARTSRRRECAFCGGVADTSDHVPPKGLFAKPLPHGMITVPSCRDCNNKASKDDEYFRTALSTRADVSESSDAAAASSRALDRISRREAPGFRKAFLDAVDEVPVFSPAGLYLGQAGRLNVDMKRINRVVDRVVRGLHFHHLGARVQEGMRLTVYSTDVIAQSNDPVYLRLVPAITWAGSAARHRVPRGVLEYKFRQTADGRGMVWLLQFYGTVQFMVIGAKSSAG